ncbi:MAG: Sapep family Mn(2+)-dependent dipeptidase, partial [Spirochaetia bacterium]
SDLKYYFDRYARPDIGFSPDAEFRVIHGEKGILNFSLHYTFKADELPVQIVKLKGGNAPNMVPDYCEAELAVDETFRQDFEDNFNSYVKKSGHPVSLEEADDGKTVIKAEGVSVHASTPEKGTNAISFIFDYLAQCQGLNASAAEFSINYRDKIGFQVHGESVGCELKDDISGPLTFNAGVAGGDKEKIDLTVNIRYPISFEGEKVIEGIKGALDGTGIEAGAAGDVKPLFVPKNDELVQKLMDAYREETGDYASGPITIGGGTYARALPKGVAFGALFPGKEKLAHEKNEYIEIDDLISATRIFASAMYALSVSP